jgi:alkanesulfonate monooxygenase SsuD/methylene tetrahydromethanopterin reductase-like flavin-dependent oxidoreductase (luciferase family)
VEVPGVEGHYHEVREITERDGLTLRQLGKQYGGRTEGDFIGTAAEVADGLQEWFTDGAADGFTLQVPYQPGGFETFTRQVVPELQKRGLFRTEYEGATLRENLGLDRPARGEWTTRAGGAA